jgi:DhnA family fructose-bisphosphate aldolase class Ia
MYGSLTAESTGEPVIDLGLYSVTFNNNLDTDLQQLEAFRNFRAEAERKRFNYFLEVFPPNVEARLSPETIPAYVNDQVSRMLAPVPASGRPMFLKIPYFGPKWMEELCAYDPSVIVGIMGGTTGTTFDSFRMLADAQRHGARAALYGRRIKDAEDPLAFIVAMRRIVDDEMSPEEAVRWYHAELERQDIRAKRCLSEDLQTQRDWD